MSTAPVVARMPFNGLSRQGHPCFLKGEARAAHGHTGLMIQKTRIKFPTRSYRDHQRIFRTSAVIGEWLFMFLMKHMNRSYRDRMRLEPETYRYASIS